MIGGCNAKQQPDDNFTFAQRKALFSLVAALQEEFAISDEAVKGQKDWGVNKACPVIRLRVDAGCEEIKNRGKEREGYTVKGCIGSQSQSIN